MTAAQRTMYHTRFCQRKLAPRCGNAVLAHNDPEVVQRGTGMKDGLEQFRGNECVQANPRFQPGAQFGTTLDRHQRTRIAPGKPRYGRDDRLDAKVRAFHPALKPPPFAELRKHPPQL